MDSLNDLDLKTKLGDTRAGESKYLCFPLQSIRMTFDMLSRSTVPISLMSGSFHLVVLQVKQPAFWWLCWTHTLTHTLTFILMFTNQLHFYFIWLHLSLHSTSAYLIEWPWLSFRAITSALTGTQFSRFTPVWMTFVLIPHLRSMKVSRLLDSISHKCVSRSSLSKGQRFVV